LENVDIAIGTSMFTGQCSISLHWGLPPNGFIWNNMMWVETYTTLRINSTIYQKVVGKRTHPQVNNYLGYCTDQIDQSWS
jgi:hypothetical protein